MTRVFFVRHAKSDATVKDDRNSDKAFQLGYRRRFHASEK